MLEHPEDVVFEYGGTPIEKMSADEYSSSILLKIAGMQIGDIVFEETNGNLPIVQFNDFRTINGLEKMGLGSHLFIEFCKQMVKYKQGYSVMAWNVMKGHDGEKVYSKWVPILWSVILIKTFGKLTPLHLPMKKPTNFMDSTDEYIISHQRELKKLANGQTIAMVSKK